MSGVGLRNFYLKNYNEIGDLIHNTYEIMSSKIDNISKEQIKNNQRVSISNTDYIYNYGDVCFIKSEYDYREWVKYIKEKNFIESVTERVNEWEECKDKPLRYRPMFAPIWSKEEVDEFTKEFESKTWDFTEPRSMKINYLDDVE